MKQDYQVFEGNRNGEPVKLSVGPDSHVKIEQDRNEQALREDSGYYIERVGQLSWRKIDDERERKTRQKDQLTSRAVSQGLEKLSEATETFFNSPHYEKFKPAIESAKKIAATARADADEKFSAVEGQTVQTADGRTATLRKNDRGEFLGLFDENGNALSRQEEESIDWKKPENAQMKSALDAVDTYRDARNVHDRRMFQAAEAVSMAEYNKTQAEKTAASSAQPAAPIADKTLTAEQTAQMQAEIARAAQYNQSNPAVFVQDNSPANPKTTPPLLSGFTQASEFGAPGRLGEGARPDREFNPFSPDRAMTLDPSLQPKPPQSIAGL